ncbi:arabinogalactan protein 20-like [Telopea speciosissima]|uniref:arabinogalactan protein 20-like n=1 Tax=Telopea speciosissima TaxID=54955 RepID=UPI001CC5AABD|nr:arabinogalactan protein 20-like [Telopea speciosissima]
MVVLRVSFGVLAIIALSFGVLAPTNDGTSIDQGIAYVLMLVALVLTYFIHPLDASSYSLF